MKKILAALLSLAILSTFAFFAIASGESKEEPTTTTAQVQNNSEDSVSEVESEAKTEKITEEKKDNSGIRLEFKEMMDEYEKFFDEYCSFMKKYSESPSDLSLISDYSKFMSQYTEYMSKLEAVEEEDLNDAELAYYIDVNARISKILLEVSNSIS